MTETSPEAAIDLHPDRYRFAFNRRYPPLLTVPPGARVRVHLSSESYAGLTGPDLDSGRVSTSTLNALAGPIAIEGAQPGDALAVAIESIEFTATGHIVYVSRWREAAFGMAESRVVKVAIEDGQIVAGHLDLPLSPMVGCIGVAPARESVSALSPTAATGGNLDLVEIAPGAVVYLPVRVPGALLSLGDLHAGMGRGEVVGAGVECDGSVTVKLDLIAGRAPAGVHVLTPQRVCFVGSHPSNAGQAEAIAVRAAWSWLTGTQGLPETVALAVCATSLHLEFGGPAGANVVAAFDRPALLRAGIDDHTPLDRSPMVG